MTAVKQAACSKAAVRRHQTTCRPDEFRTTVWRMWWRQTSGDGDCASLSWGQPIWQGLWFSGLVHAEIHPCGSNFIQSIFETVQAGCINSVLVQTIPSVNDSIWEKKIFPNIRVKSWFTNYCYYGHVPYHYHQAWIKPLCVFLCTGLTCRAFLVCSSTQKLQF